MRKTFNLIVNYWRPVTAILVLLGLALLIAVIVATIITSQNNPEPKGVNGSAPLPIKFINVGNNDNSYYWHVANVTMPNGQILTCIKVDSNGDSPVSVSCNWQLFNQESGR